MVQAESLHYDIEEELDAMENEALATLQLAAGVVATNNIEALRTLLAQLHAATDAAAVDSTWSLVHTLLVHASDDDAAQMVADTVLLAAMHRALQTPQPPCEYVLQCISVLVQHGVELFALDWELVLTVAKLMCGDSVSDSALPILIDVLKALTRDCALNLFAIENTVAVALAHAEPLFALKSLRCVLAARDSWTYRYAPALSDLDASVYIQECVGAAIKALRFGTPLEAVVAVQALLSSGVETIAMALVVNGGATALVRLRTSAQCDRLRDAASALLEAICKTDERYIGVLVKSQREHPSVDILAHEFCASDLTQFVGFDFARSIEQLSSHNVEDVQQALGAMPRSINVLVVLCLDFELLHILLKLLLAPDAPDAVKSQVWTLLVEILYELPTVGATSICGRQDIAIAALELLSADQPLAHRQRAALLLTTSLGKSTSVRSVIVSECGVIVTLVRLLALECDASFAQTLSEIVRALATASTAWAAEVDAVVHGLLDSGGDDHTIQYQNVLSIYRWSKRAVLGRGSDDAVANLKRSIEILESGHAIEKLIVLTWLRRAAVSWTREHWRVLSTHVLEIVPILLSEVDEIKDLGVDVLAVAAAADGECCDRIVVAQRVFWESDPSFFYAVQRAHQAKRAVGHPGGVAAP